MVSSVRRAVAGSSLSNLYLYWTVLWLFFLFNRETTVLCGRGLLAFMNGVRIICVGVYLRLWFNIILYDRQGMKSTVALWLLFSRRTRDLNPGFKSRQRKNLFCCFLLGPYMRIEIFSLGLHFLQNPIWVAHFLSFKKKKKKISSWIKVVNMLTFFVCVF